MMMLKSFWAKQLCDQHSFCKDGYIVGFFTIKNAIVARLYFVRVTFGPRTLDLTSNCHNLNSPSKRRSINDTRWRPSSRSSTVRHYDYETMCAYVCVN